MRIMKLAALILLLGCLQVSARSYSQSVTLKMRKTPLSQVFREIKKQTGYSFFYDEAWMQMASEVTIHVEKAELTEALELCFKYQPLTFTIVNKVVVVKLKENDKIKVNTAVNSSPPSLGIQVRGKVTDEEGNPLVGATVMLKGTNKGVNTGADGSFMIEIPEHSSNILIVSYIGMQSKEVNIANQTSVSITLSKKAAEQQEVVVVGYGTQKKVNLTGSVSTVTAKQMENRAAVSVTTVLAGQVPGLTITQKGGKPGSNFGDLKIRGIGTFSGTYPLILVDNIEANISDVDINDIETVSVLKDASSAAIYGVRGANGVILITTKKGKSGKPVISYNGGIGKMSPIALPARVDAYTYAKMYNEARLNDGSAARYTQADLDAWKNGTGDPLLYQNNDQYSELLRTGDPLRHFHSLSLSGGTEATQYYMSAGYNYEGGLISTFGYDRINYRLNLSQKVTNKLTAGVNLSGAFTNTKNNSQDAGQIMTEAYRSHPSGAIYYDKQGYWATGTYWGGTRNMIAYVKAPLGTNNSKNNDYISTVFAEYQPIKDLKVYARLTARNDNYRSYYTRDQIFWYNYIPAAGTTPASFSPVEITAGNRGKSASIAWDITKYAQITYTKSIREKHNVNTLIGYENRNVDNESLEAQRNGLRGVNEISQINGVTDAADNAYGNLTQYRSRSLFGRINYNYNETYLLEANLRADATSRFHPDRRLAYFPSFSAGWNISNESFFKSNFINLLKLRGGWGKLGNQTVPDYFYISLYKPDRNYLFGNTVLSSIVESSPLANVEIGWERTATTNIGVDVAMFKNALSVTLEGYDRLTTGILRPQRQAAILGIAPPTINSASVNNKGIDLTINYKNKISGFNYFVNLIGGYVRNKITDLKGTDQPGFSVGDPIQNIYGFVAKGIFKTQAEIDAAPDQTYFGGKPVPGDVQYADINGKDANGKLTGKPDGKVNADDRKILGSQFPRITYGVQAGFDWKGFDFSMLWQGTGAVQVITSGPLVQPFASEARPLQSMVGNTWTPENPNAPLPRLSLAKAGRNYNTSTFWMKSGAYAKLRNLQLGYSFPKTILQKWGMTKVRFFVSAENILQISKFNFDPEYAHGDPTNWDAANYPSSRIYYGGINVSF